MAVRKYKPITPGRRGASVSDFKEVTRDQPEKSLTRPLKKRAGRNAHGRITATTLSIIPLAVAFLMFYTNREYIEFFVKDPVGNQMAGVAIFFQLVGYLIMKKIVSIEI